MKCYNAVSKRMTDGSLDFTISYKLESENELFFLDNDLDVLILYEGDKKYIVHLGLFVEKIPYDFVEYKIKVAGNLFWKQIEKIIIDYILTDYYKEDYNFKNYMCENNLDVSFIKKELEKSDDYVDAFCNSFYSLTDYFDSWAVIKTEEDFMTINKILLKPKEDEHIETINWE